MEVPIAGITRSTTELRGRAWVGLFFPLIPGGGQEGDFVRAWAWKWVRNPGLGVQVF